MPLTQPAGLGAGDVEETQKGVGAVHQTAVRGDRPQATMAIEPGGLVLPYGIISLLAALVVFLSFAIIAAHSVCGKLRAPGSSPSSGNARLGYFFCCEDAASPGKDRQSMEMELSKIRVEET